MVDVNFKTHLLEELYWIKGLKVIGITLFKYTFRERLAATWPAYQLLRATQR